MDWLVSEVLDWLKENLSSDTKIFEYSSGNSTLFFANSDVGELISIEYDPIRYNEIQQALKYNYNNIKIEHRLIEPIIDKIPVPYSHLSFGSKDERFLYHNFKDYVNYIKNFPDNLFDFILINGRARASCIAAAMPRIKIDGYLILNNSDCFDYSNAIDLFLKNFTSMVFSQGKEKTTLWKIEQKYCS